MATKAVPKNTRKPATEPPPAPVDDDAPDDAPELDLSGDDVSDDGDDVGPPTFIVKYTVQMVAGLRNGAVDRTSTAEDRIEVDSWEDAVKQISGLFGPVSFQFEARTNPGNQFAGRADGWDHKARGFESISYADWMRWHAGKRPPLWPNNPEIARGSGARDETTIPHDRGSAPAVREGSGASPAAPVHYPQPAAAPAQDARLAGRLTLVEEALQDLTRRADRDRRDSADRVTEATRLLDAAEQKLGSAARTAAEEVRAKLVNEVGDLSRKLNDLASDLKDKLRELKQSIEDRVKVPAEAAAAAKQVADSTHRELDALAHRLNDFASQVKQKGNDDPMSMLSKIGEFKTVMQSLGITGEGKAGGFTDAVGAMSTLIDKAVTAKERLDNKKRGGSAGAIETSGDDDDDTDEEADTDEETDDDEDTGMLDALLPAWARAIKAELVRQVTETDADGNRTLNVEGLAAVAFKATNGDPASRKLIGEQEPAALAKLVLSQLPREVRTYLKANDAVFVNFCGLFIRRLGEMVVAARSAAASVPREGTGRDAGSPDAEHAAVATRSAPVVSPPGAIRVDAGSRDAANGAVALGGEGRSDGESTGSGSAPAGVIASGASASAPIPSRDHDTRPEGQAPATKTLTRKRKTA